MTGSQLQQPLPCRRDVVASLTPFCGPSCSAIFQRLGVSDLKEREQDLRCSRELVRPSGKGRRRHR